jgi:polysaccharide biosynthesis/export protein
LNGLQRAFRVISSQAVVEIRTIGLARTLLCSHCDCFTGLTPIGGVIEGSRPGETASTGSDVSLTTPQRFKHMSQHASSTVRLATETDLSTPLRRIAFPAGAILASAVVLAACSVVPTLPPAPPEPAPQAFNADLPPYRIQVGDVLEVRLLLNPELNEEVTVRPDGHISTTVVPDAVAYGVTPADLAASLRRVYSKELQNPRVSVVVKSFAPTRVYVGGEVNTPGEFVTVGPTLSLSQALARAGGTKLSSDDTAVFVIRRGIGDKPEFLSTRWKQVRQGTDPTADVRLAPYDVVYVPKLGIAEVYQFYNQYIGQFANPSFGFSYLLNPTAAVSTGTVIQATPPAR